MGQQMGDSLDLISFSLSLGRTELESLNGMGNFGTSTSWQGVVASTTTGSFSILELRV